MKKKTLLPIALGVFALGISTFTIGSTLGWFKGGNNNAEKVINGQVGLRGYFFTGDGTQEHPYEIVSPVHFYNLTRLQNLGIFPHKTYFQVGHVFEEGQNPKCINDDGQGGTIYTEYLDMGTLSNSITILPIGSEGTPFVGEFNGQGLPIRNLKVSGYPEDIGVFGYVDYQGVVEGLVCEDLEICSLGYNSTPTDQDNLLFSADIDDIFSSSHYLATDTSLSVYKKNGSAFEATNLKKLNGISGTSLLALNDSANKTYDYYNKAYFLPTFPNVANDPFTYSWVSSSPLIQKAKVIDIDGDSVLDEAIMINMDALKNSSDFNSGGDMQADTRISLVASTTVDGYTFSRVIQSYVIEFYSNGDTYIDGDGRFTAAIFCDYLNTGSSGDRNTNYHHGNNIGFLAGHVNGTMRNCFVYDAKFTFNKTGFTPILTESDTGLIGEIGTNVINTIDPDYGLTTNGDVGIINYSRIYSLIRRDFVAGDKPVSGSATQSDFTRVNYVSYKSVINSGESFNNYEEYLRRYNFTSGNYEYITGVDKNMIDYNDKTGDDCYTITGNEKVDFNSVDFIWNKLIQDDRENDIDRGLGVFKIATPHCDGAMTGDYNTYSLDRIGNCRIINGTPKTKVYFSTAEYDHTVTNSYSWDDRVPQRATSLPSYSDVNSFGYPFSRDFNYVFELDLIQMALAGNNNYMYNTNSPWLTNYLSSVLRDKYGAPINPGNPKFGFMFLSDQNERLSSLSSHMPVQVPGDKYLYPDGNYYPSNSIVFRIENDNGANVSVVGNGGDISIYRNDPTSNAGVQRLYSMRATNFNNEGSFQDYHRYFTYNINGETTIAATVNRNMHNDNNALYGHIFKLPKGDYVLGARSGSANVYFLAVQGQTEASIGDKTMANIGYTVENVDLLTEQPTLANYPSDLALSNITFRAFFNDSVAKEYLATIKEVGGNNYISLEFSDSPVQFVTYLVTYTPLKRVHYIQNNRYEAVNVIYRTS